MGGSADFPSLRDDALAHALSALAARAAHCVSGMRNAALAAWDKPDRSPVTAADLASEGVILEGLARLLPGVPVVSEESRAATRTVGETFLLVDPLDGTREFLAGRDEFTINIAVIQDARPAFGVIAAPALDLLWRGSVGVGAERLRLASLDTGLPVRTRPWPEHHAVALVSRSHLDAGTTAWLHKLPEIKVETCGSALKFCRLAEGQADLYPRLAPAMEWDIAAGHALLQAAGGELIEPNGGALLYGAAAAGYRVSGFVAVADAARASWLSRRLE